MNQTDSTTVISSIDDLAKDTKQKIQIPKWISYTLLAGATLLATGCASLPFRGNDKSKENNIPVAPITYTNTVFYNITTTGNQVKEESEKLYRTTKVITNNNANIEVGVVTPYETQELVDPSITLMLDFIGYKEEATDTMDLTMEGVLYDQLTKGLRTKNPVGKIPAIDSDTFFKTYKIQIGDGDSTVLPVEALDFKNEKQTNYDTIFNQQKEEANNSIYRKREQIDLRK